MDKLELIDGVLEDFANFNVWESQQKWEANYDRQANIANSRNRAKATLQKAFREVEIEGQIKALKKLENKVQMMYFVNDEYTKHDVVRWAIIHDRLAELTKIKEDTSRE